LARMLVMANSSDCPPIRKEIGGALGIRVNTKTVR